jgi:hypothetical protein
MNMRTHHGGWLSCKVGTAPTVKRTSGDLRSPRSIYSVEHVECSNCGKVASIVDREGNRALVRCLHCFTEEVISL